VWLKRPNKEREGVGSLPLVGAVSIGKFKLKTQLGLIGRRELEEEQRRLLEIKEEIENLSN